MRSRRETDYSLSQVGLRAKPPVTNKRKRQQRRKQERENSDLPSWWARRHADSPLSTRSLPDSSNQVAPAWVLSSVQPIEAHSASVKAIAPIARLAKYIDLHPFLPVILVVVVGSPAPFPFASAFAQ
jgi:hypothetical protein